MFTVPMRPIRFRFLALGLAAAALPNCASNPHTLNSRPPTPQAEVALPSTHWSTSKQAVHVLNRLAFGYSPADWEALEKIGVERWINQQLKPTEISDAWVAYKLSSFPTLTRSSAELEEEYAPPVERAKMLGLSPASPEAKAAIEAIPHEELPQHILEELMAAKLVRAVESRRQLQEVLVDFWFNHFNVSAEKGPVRWMVTSYERDAIRPHVFGYFRELLGATAHHPAMLFYLDNWLSIRELDPSRTKPGSPKAGLNENYARELLELHTVGVNGGYTQQDVRETARCFTGWSIEQPNRKATFVFRARAHDPGPKHVIGLSISRGGGASDGEAALDYLAVHPATARFIATKLCRKFVSDNPPPQLVDRIAAVFLKTGGYLPSVYAALFSAAEFWSDEAFGAKTKTPFEFAVSGIRALGGQTTGDVQLLQQIERLGEPLYRAPAPTGYPDVAEAWINAGALLNRINFGLALASNRIHGTTADVRGYARRHAAWADVHRVADAFANFILHRELSPQTRDTLYRAVSEQRGEEPADGERRPIDVPLVAGLMLGSPDFQKR